jgi:hypothetical protein
MLLGYAFSLVAIFIRQLGILIPLSFLGAYLAKNRIGLKTFVNAILPTAIFACLLFVYPFVLRRTIGLPALYNRSFEPILEATPLGWFQIPIVFADRVLVEIFYLGLFLLPFLIVLGLNAGQVSPTQKKRLSMFVWFILFGVMLGFSLLQGRTMPLIGNIIRDIGLRPALLRDTYRLGLLHWPTAPKELWIIITIAAALGSVLLIRRSGIAFVEMVSLLNSRSNSGQVYGSTLLFLAVFLYAVFIAITGFLDRYLIWPLPLLMCLVQTRKNPARLNAFVLPFSAAAAILFIYGLFALGGTHDYLAWNRARWQAVMDLMEKDGVSYNNIDGGFEFNGWYAYNPGYHIDSSKSWWWVENDDYMISFGPVPHYIEIKRYPFDRWIPPARGNILVLQRVVE